MMAFIIRNMRCEIRKNPILFLVAAVFTSTILLSSCFPFGESSGSLPTHTPAPPTATATSTPIWFPPTATQTPYPTATPVEAPVQEFNPVHGELIFSDDFSNPDLWTLNRTSSASAAITNNELTLALLQPDGYILSVRQQPDLRDFYMEVTASPSLCMGSDEYGIIFRYNDTGNLFRFSLTCDGRARVDRLLKSQPSSPQPLIFSGAIPPGAPSRSRLAISSDGRNMQFYANGEPLFSISDPNLAEGRIGLFIRSNGENAVTVNFQELEVYRINP